MRVVVDFLHLLGVNLLVKYRNLKEFFRVCVRYYPRMPFMKTDLSLLKQYFFKTPFQISKEFLLQKKEEEIYVYGETPLTTMERIAIEFYLTSNDTVFELGCGRGRTCFWLASFVGCRVVGIEYIPEFVQKANQVKADHHLSSPEFRLQNMLKADFQGATVLYLYGTCYSEAFIKKLIDKLVRLPKGTKVITVSYALNEFSREPFFETIKKVPCQFTWGQADVYLQILRTSHALLK